MEMLPFILLMVLLGGAASQRTCVDQKPALSLPSCTGSCIAGDNQSEKGNCGTNLRDFCTLSDGIKTYFDSFGACLLAHCPDENNRYDFVQTFKSQCASFERPFDTSVIQSEFAEVLKNGPARSTAMTISTQSSSTEKSSTSSIATTTSTPSKESRSSSQPTSASSALPSTKPDSSPNTSTTPAAPQNTASSSRPASNIPAPDPNHTQNILTSSWTLSISSHRTTSSPIATSSSPPSQPSISTPTIAGAAAGGTAFLALALGAAFYFLRRRRRNRSQAFTHEQWDPSRSSYGPTEPTLPQVGGLNSSAVTEGIYEKSPDGDGTERYATHVPRPTMNIQHVRSMEGMRFNDSAYPELETRSPVLAHSPSPQQMGQGWHEASELHTDSVIVGSPVSELESMTPIVRIQGGDEMGRNGGGVELDAGHGAKGRCYAGRGVGTNF